MARWVRFLKDARERVGPSTWQPVWPAGAVVEIEDASAAHWIARGIAVETEDPAAAVAAGPDDQADDDQNATGADPTAAEPDQPDELVWPKARKTRKTREKPDSLKHENQ